MKTLVRDLLLPLLAMAAVTAQPLPNGGFEAGDDGWQVTVGEGGEGLLEIDPEFAHEGAHSARLRKTNGAGFLRLDGPRVELAPDQGWRVRGWLRLPQRSRHNVYYMLSQHDAAGKLLLPNLFGPVRGYFTGDRWEPLEMTFPSRPETRALTVQVVVTGGPVELWLDDFTVEPADREELNVSPYEPPAREDLPPLEPALARLAQRTDAVASRRVVAGRPRLFVGGEPLSPAWHVTPFHSQEFARVADFAAAGVHTHLVSLVLGRDVYGQRGPWLGAGAFDWTEVEQRLMRVLRVDPEANIVFYLAVDPYRDWGAEHLDDVSRDQDGNLAVVSMHPVDYGREPDPTKGERYGPSLVSAALRADTVDALQRFVAQVESLPAGKAVIGYHIAGLNDGQFFHWFQPGHQVDYSPAAVTAFRDWLRRRYGSDEALQRAWGQPGVTLATAAIPAGDRRSRPGLLLDPATDHDVADHRRFYSEGVAETLLIYARSIKAATGGRKLVGTYYEDLAAGVDSHFALGRLLESPDLDFHAGPTAYGVRQPGSEGRTHATLGSLLLHGRIWLSEQDFRSIHSRPVRPDYDWSVGRALTSADHLAMVRRESGMMLANGHGSWWYDMDGGWFADAGIMAGVAEAKAAWQRDRTLLGRPEAEVAVFIDERSVDFLREGQAGYYRQHAIRNQISLLNRSGVPYHLYLLGDLAQPDLPDYRLYLFLAPLHLGEPERAAIEQLKRDDHWLVFSHAAGLYGPQGAAAPADPVEAISTVTGIRVRAMPGETMLTASAEIGAAVLDGVEVVTGSGMPGPAFAIDDPAAAILGRYEDGSPAIGVKRQADWTAVFFGPLGLSEGLVNRLTRAAGAWVVAEPGDAVYANQWFLTVHGIYPGPKTLRLRYPSRVVDLATGQQIAARAEVVELELAYGETRWFALTPVATES